MASERLEFLAVLLLTGVLIGVSLGLGGSGGAVADDPDPEQLVREAVESTESEPIEGVRTEVYQQGSTFEMVTVAVAEEPPGHSRIEVVEAVETETRSDLTVINESTMWRYFQDEQRAVRIESGNQWRSDTRRFQVNIRELLDQYDVSYAGTETVENRTTHVVELAPPEEAAVELSLDVHAGDRDYGFALQEASEDRWFVTQETWWIDTDTDYPIKQEVEWIDENGNVVASTIRMYHELTVGAEIDDEAFDFDPPKRVDVSEAALPETASYPSREAANSAVEFELPEPALPSGYDLQGATVWTFRNGNQSVMLTYSDGSRTVTVHVSERATRGDDHRIVERNVGEVDGTLLTVDGRTSLAWGCDSLSHRVSGLRDGEALTGIAESIGCDSGQATDAGNAPADGSGRGGGTWPGPSSPSPRLSG